MDLAFGTLVFLLLFALLYNHWQSNSSMALQEQGFEETRAAATRTLDFLVNSRGFPQNWNLLQEGDINSIGLAREKRVLDPLKVSRFVSMDYNFARSKLNLGKYDFFFSVRNSAGPDLNYGNAEASDESQVTIERIVDYNGVESIAGFTAFRK